MGKKTVEVEEVRNDVFLSFHGSEVLYHPRDDGKDAATAGACYKMRELAERLTGGVLPSHWVNEMGRIGTLQIFFDHKNLTESHDGLIQNTILEGLLQTQEGGVVAILASEGYFNSKWCIFELLAA